MEWVHAFKNGNGFFWLPLKQEAATAAEPWRSNMCEKMCDGTYQPCANAWTSSNILNFPNAPRHINAYQCINVSRQNNSINSPRSIRPAVKIRRSGPVLSCGPSALLAWPCSDSRELHLQPKVNRKAGTEKSNVIFFKCWYPIPCTLETKWNN